jgi:hypothetical protein
MMDSRKISDWLQVIGVFGVMLSLVFVGIEIRQSREIAIADVFQQKSALAVQVQQGFVSPELFSAAVRKLLSGEVLSPMEKGLLQFGQTPWFQYWENVHFQYEIGLLSEEAWQGSRNAMRNRLSTPIYQEWWESDRLNWRESFTSEVDTVLSEVRASQPD